MYPIRGAVTFKWTAGTNVASDALSNLSSGGVTGGALIIIGEDYGEGSSIMQERSHAFAMKSQIWLLDPRPNLPSIVKAVEDGFALSEASNTPVMLEVRIRACHVHGSFIAKDNARRRSPCAGAEAPARDTGRIVLPPASFAHEREKIASAGRPRWNLSRAHAERALRAGRRRDRHHPAGRHVQRRDARAAAARARRHLGRDARAAVRAERHLSAGGCRGRRFCAGKRAVLVVEEGQPDFIEQALQHDPARGPICQAGLLGKDVLPMAGEYTAPVMEDRHAALSRSCPAAPLLAPPATAARPSRDPRRPQVRALSEVVPARPPGFCTGCPERPIFSAMKLVEKELGPHHIAADIGCHLFSILPPFNIGATTMGYGLGPASASALNVRAGQARRSRSWATAGSGTTGSNSGIGNAVFNKSDNVIRRRRQSLLGRDRRAGHPVVARRQPTGARPGIRSRRRCEGVGARWVRPDRPHLRRRARCATCCARR